MLEKNPRRLFIAGGFIRTIIAHEPLTDIDLFTTSKEDAKRYAAEYMDLVESDNRRITQWDTQNACTLIGTKPTIQFIHRWTFDHPTQCIESFDFTISSAVIWYDHDKWHSRCHNDFYADLAGRRLEYLSPQREEEPGGSILRVLKFYQKGYRIPLDSFAKVLTRLMKGVNWDAISANDEKWLSDVINGLLREVDPSIPIDVAGYLPKEEEEKSSREEQSDHV
jgi:hypothetical protein